MYYFYMWDSDHKLHPSGRTKGLCIIEMLSAPPLVRQLVGQFARIALLLGMLSEEGRCNPRPVFLARSIKWEAPGLLDILPFQLR